MLTAEDLLLSEDEVRKATGGYKQPSKQLVVLHEKGFVRARRGPMTGRIILERAHYEAVIAGTYGKGVPNRAPEPPPGWNPWIRTKQTPAAWMEANWPMFLHSPLHARGEKVPPRQVPDTSGVYLLFDGDELIYVGESVNIQARLWQHEESKQFDGVFAFAVPDLFRLRVECVYIEVLRPPLNIKIHGAGMAGLGDELRRLWKC